MLGLCELGLLESILCLNYAHMFGAMFQTNWYELE